jgi:hypothetical protein
MPGSYASRHFYVHLCAPKTVIYQPSEKVRRFTGAGLFWRGPSSYNPALPETAERLERRITSGQENRNDEAAGEEREEESSEAEFTEGFAVYQRVSDTRHSTGA